MPSISSKYHREVLKTQAAERQEVRNKRTPLQQLEMLHYRKVSVPSLTPSELKELNLDKVKEFYCKEVWRLVCQIVSG